MSGFRLSVHTLNTPPCSCKQSRTDATVNSLKLHGPSMLPDKAKSVVCSIISLALSFWMKYLVIGQLQKPAKFSAFHWSTSWSQALIGQLLGTSRVVHLPKWTVMVFSPYRMLNYPIGLQRTHSCPSFNRFWPYRILHHPIESQRTCSWPSLSDFDYILVLVSADFSGPNHRIGQGCAGRA